MYELNELRDLVKQNGRGQFIHTLNVLKGEIEGAKYFEQMGHDHLDYDLLQATYDGLWGLFPDFQPDYEEHLKEMEVARKSLEK